MRFYTFLLLLLCISVGSACAEARSTLEVLADEVPSATWNAESALTADVNCDGTKDTIMLGRENDLAWIGVVLGAKKAATDIKPLVTRFFISRGKQSAFCAPPARIRVYDHDCEDAEGSPLTNCKAVAGCQDFQVEDDECDPISFYWNDAEKTLSAWRL
jgi:hypothetical protein